MTKEKILSKSRVNIGVTAIVDFGEVYYREKEVLEAMEEYTQQSWVSASQPPKAKEEWGHTEQCLVWYKGSEHEIESYGIAYYNYDPPYSKPGWTDFHQFGRQPQFWMPLPDKPKTLT